MTPIKSALNKMHETWFIDDEPEATISITRDERDAIVTALEIVASICALKDFND